LDVVASVIDPAIRAFAPSDVIIRPRVTSAELHELYRKAHVFVMPSLVEGFGLVYLEALAAGCHCIYTPNTGVPDLSLPTYAGTEAPPGNVEALRAILTDTAHKANSGELHSALIQSVTRNRPWSKFREEIMAAINLMNPLIFK